MAIVKKTTDNQFLDKVKKIHSFKIFKKSTKFKKYNKGITRFIMNRKRYTIRKKRTSLFYKFVIPILWTSFIFSKKQLTRFYQNFQLLNYTVSAINNKYLVSCYDTFTKSSSQTAGGFLSFNSFFISKKFFTTTSLFKWQMSRSMLKLFDSTKIGFVTTPNFNLLKKAASSSNLIQDKNIILCKHINQSSLTTNLIISPLLRISTFLLRNVRQILIKITLLIIFIKNECF